MHEFVQLLESLETMREVMADADWNRIAEHMSSMNHQVSSSPWLLGSQDPCWPQEKRSGSNSYYRHMGEV